MRRPQTVHCMQELGEPILTLDAGIAAKAFVSQNSEVTRIVRSCGNVQAALAAAPHRITNARSG